MRPDELAAALSRERAAFFEALDARGPDALGVPALVGEWSARELIAHLGYWAGHAAELIHAVEGGRAAEAGIGDTSVDEVNETVAKIARQAGLETVRRREAASVEALLQRLGTLDPALLETRLAGGSTLGDGIAEDGPDHYAEHAAALRTDA
jgi:hypothetical protein